jgi:hypothetical protein
MSLGLSPCFPKASANSLWYEPLDEVYAYLLIDQRGLLDTILSLSPSSSTTALYVDFQWPHGSTFLATVYPAVLKVIDPYELFFILLVSKP